MDYIEVSFTINPISPVVADVLAAHLADIGFDSFVESEKGMLAYIAKPSFKIEQLKAALDLVRDYGSVISFSQTEIADRNWNKEWESNFNPISIEKFCYIRAPFHTPQAGYSMELIIEPKMAFGTGHHQTTWLMARELFETNITGKTVLDMGCGTGILAIIAEKLGAANLLAIDNDEWAYRNAIENAEINSCSRIKVELGDAHLLKGKEFDVILANINLNILLADMETYSKSLNPGGTILFSGILSTDIETLKNKIEQTGLIYTKHKTRNDWAMVGCVKK
jgi:ribosomal protein L11 methyltransferase